MKQIASDPNLVAACGLYCGACPSYLKEKCQGCKKNESATWCKVRSCCLENKITTCAECKTFQDPRDCSKFHNFISRIIGFFLRSDRRACVLQIRQKGLQGHADEMAKNQRQTIPP